MKPIFIVILMVILSSFSFGLDLSFDDIQGGSEENVTFKKINEGESLSFSVTRSDPNDLSPVEIWNAPKGSLFIDDVFTWTPGKSQDGIYNVNFSCGDAYASIRIVVSNTEFEIQHSHLFRYMFTATDPDDDNVEITAVDIPDGATFTGGQFSPKLFEWTPTKDQVGIYQMILTATDNPLEGGDSKQDISIISIKVVNLSDSEKKCDFNEDDMVNMEDFFVFAGNWMAGVPKSNIVETSVIEAPVSEPLVVDPPVVDPPVLNYVYKTSSGSKYHKIDCSYLSSGSEQVLLEDAIALGLGPCSRCKPDDVSYTSYPKKSFDEILKDLFGSMQKIAPMGGINAPFDMKYIERGINDIDLKMLAEILAEEWLSDSDIRF